MKSLSTWVNAVVAITLFASPAVAADAIAAGKIKSIDSDKKQFVLTDSASKDHTFKFGEDVVMNRDGKESKSNLKVADAVNVCYAKGLVSSTAHYILVQEGSTKDCTLVRGTFKGYDVNKKEISFTDSDKKAWTFAKGDSKVRLNKEDSKIEDLKIGDRAVLIVETKDDKASLKCMMAERK